MYRADSSRPSSVYSSSVKKRKPSPLMMTAGRHSKKTKRTSSGINGKKAEVETVAKKENVNKATKAFSGDLQPEA